MSNNSNTSNTVDLRSDTVTSPCKGMRTAMAEAIVGDDVYGEDHTTMLLEVANCYGSFVPEVTCMVFICTHILTQHTSSEQGPS